MKSIISSFSTRIIALIFFFILGVGGSFFFAWVGLSALAQNAKDINATRVPQVERMTDLKYHVARMQSQMRQVFIDVEHNEKLRTITELDSYIKQSIGVIEQFKEYIQSEEDKRQVFLIQKNLENYAEVQHEFSRLITSSEYEAALGLIDVANMTREPLIKLVNESTEWQKTVLKERAEKIENDVAQLQIIMASIGGVLLAFGTAMGFWLISGLGRRICQVEAVAQRIASQDLSETVKVQGNDEFNSLFAQLEAMRFSLFNVVGTTRQASNSILIAANEVAAGKRDLSNRTEKTASSLEQTASSMEEITQSVKSSTEAAQRADKLALSATGIAKRGGTVVAEVMGTMQEIQDSSRKIGEIIGVIDSIAFQTNILALNAAVEAARAGAQGRGFAVVAGEVRSLAQRSAVAAKEIKELITTSVSKVNEGNENVKEAGKTMEEIVKAVESVNSIIADISSSAREQMAGITQINAAMSGLEQMTQQNAALVEETTASAQSMEAQAKKLAGTVSVFKLD